MSKAFTSEETQDEAPRGRAPPRAGEERPITRAGRAALEAELRAVQRERAEFLRAPRGSEIERKARLEELSRREELFAATLATAVERGAPGDLSRVAFGSIVEVEDERGKRVVYQLVGPDETDAKGASPSRRRSGARCSIRKWATRSSWSCRAAPSCSRCARSAASSAAADDMSYRNYFVLHSNHLLRIARAPSAKRRSRCQG